MHRAAFPRFGNLYGLSVWVDTALAEDETIIYQAGTGCTTAPQRRHPSDGFRRAATGAPPARLREPPAGFVADYPLPAGSHPLMLTTQAARQ